MTTIIDKIQSSPVDARKELFESIDAKVKERIEKRDFDSKYDEEGDNKREGNTDE